MTKSIEEKSVFSRRNRLLERNTRMVINCNSDNVKNVSNEYGWKFMMMLGVSSD